MVPLTSFPTSNNGSPEWGRLANGVTMEQADAAIWEELEKLKQEVTSYELQKIQNRVESSMEFEDVNLLNRAYHLAYYELLRDAHLYNEEKVHYFQVTLDDMKQVASDYLTENRCSTLYYKSIKN